MDNSCILSKNPYLMYLKPLCLICLVLCLEAPCSAISEKIRILQPTELTSDTSGVIILEPWTYHEDFEDRDLGAWASYPLWQDIAYNQNFRVNEILPGDPNISIVQKVTPYTAVDNYAGAQKLLDMHLVPGATIKFRYFLKTHQSCSWLKVRLAAGAFGKLDVTIEHPKINEWQWVTLNFQDFIEANPKLANEKNIKIFALAFLCKFSKADPDMPIYLGLDDVSFVGARPMAFKFSAPEMYKLPEFAPYIPKKHYAKGSTFQLRGTWSPELTKVALEISPFTDRKDLRFQGSLDHENGIWSMKPLVLDFEEGLYLGRLSGYGEEGQVSESTFTIHIAPGAMKGKHPRLLFDEENRLEIQKRFNNEPFQHLYQNIAENAKALRQKIPVESLHFDLDQFPDEDWLPTWDAWGSRIYHTGASMRLNARAYAFHGDQEAGEYVRQVLLRLASWPNWTHPWQTKRGRFSEHRTGHWSHRVAEAYDLVYHLMSADEQSIVRKAILRNIVEGVHRTFIHNDNITAATSNWLAMTVGGSLMCMSAIFEDGESTENLEPYFTGAILKLNKFIHRVTDSKDGGWGEGFGYNNYSFSNLSYSLPSLENVFNIDLSRPLVGTYNEYIWAGLIKNKRWFEYGDSKGDLNSATNWAYLLNKYEEPRLSWFYNFLKESGHQTYEDVLFDVSNIEQQDPFEESPIKLFRNLGTTVFKSGWEPDDFVFVMRTGPAYNHQHLDQGSFWLADRGEIFVQERPLSNSHYYDDPIYESWLTQPVGHSTILINKNHQSQRVGDHLNFAPGFDDYAFVSHFLDGEDAAFSSGNIGRLYWGAVDGLSRNVLYLKPRTILLLDVATPAQQDAEVTLLFQTEKLEDIRADEERSAIIKDKATMHVLHLAPESNQVAAVETPHYLRTLQNTRPLVREGMLNVSAQTKGEPLVMANLITTAAPGQEAKVTTAVKENYIQGMTSEQNFAFSTKVGTIYSTEGYTTDALAITWKQDKVFVAKASVLRTESIEIASDVPVTFQFSLQDHRIKYYADTSGNFSLKLAKEPSTVFINNKPTNQFSYDARGKILNLSFPAGEGTILFR
jgi:hypothetical protein